MVSNGQEQHSIMKFAVFFLKVFAINMLWRAQFLTELHAVFFVHLIYGSCYHYKLKIWTKRFQENIKFFNLKLAII